MTDYSKVQAAAKALTVANNAGAENAAEVRYAMAYKEYAEAYRAENPNGPRLIT